METNPLVTPSGLPVSFDDVHYSVHALGEVHVSGFVAVLGNRIRIGARTLYETSESLYEDVKALAVQWAERETAIRYDTRRDLRAWLARQ